MGNELTKLFKKAAINAIVNEGVPGIIGKRDGTIYYSDPGCVKHRNKVWVKIGEGDERNELVVSAPGVPKIRNLPIIIASRGGTPTAIRIDTAGAAYYTDGRMSQVAEHSWTHQRSGTDPLYITGPAFIPLMARPSDPTAMTVTVEPGFYRYQGVEKVLTQTISADLSSFRPGGTQEFHFVIICLDRKDNDLFVLDGVDYFEIALATVLTSLSGLNERYYPLASIRLYAGQTKIFAYDITYDLRLWGGESTDFDQIMTDANADIMVDANGNVMVGSG